MAGWLRHLNIAALPARVTVPAVYAAIGLAWILGGDLLLVAVFGGNARLLAWLSSGKAAVFVVVSAIALYAVFKRRQQSAVTGPESSASATVLLLLATAAVVLWAGYGLYKSYAVAEAAEWHNDLTARADARVALVLSSLKTHETMVQLTADSELLEQQVWLWQHARSDVYAGLIRKRLEALLVSGRGEFVSVELRSRDGHLVSSAGENGATELDAALADAALRRKGVVFGEPYVGHTPARRPLLAIAAPVGQDPETSQALAVIVVNFDMRAVLEATGTVRVPPTRTSVETLLVRMANGHLAILAERPGATWERVEKPGGLADTIIRAADAGTLTPTLDHRGTAVMAVVRPVPGTDWYVVTKADEQEIDATTDRLAAIGLVVLLLTALLLAVGLAWIRQRAHAAAGSGQIATLLEHFDLANRYANDIVLLIDPDDSRIVQANQRALDSYRYSRSEIIGLDVRELRAVGTDDDEPGVGKFGDTGTLALVFETMHRRKDGSEFPVEVSVRRFEIGGRRFSQAIIRDASERKRREEQLARLALERDRAATQLRRQFDSMPMACLITDAQFQVVDANPAFEKLFGWKKHELRGAGLEPIIAPVDLPGVYRLFNRVSNSTGSLVNVNDNVTRDGRVLTCRWTNTALRTQDGKFAGLLAMCDNLTVEIELKREVATREAMFAALAETTPVGVFQTGPDGRVTYMNPTLMQMLGLEPGKLDEAMRGLYLEPEDRPRAGKLLREILGGAEPPPQEFRYVTPQGATGWLLVHAHPVNDEHGMLKHVVGTATDVTRLKEQEAVLEKAVAARTAEYQQARDMAERASKAKTDFLTTVSHELRAPLNSIVGFSELLLEGETGSLKDVQQRQLTIIRDAARRQRKLINDLLDIGRMESDRPRIKLEPVRIDDLLARAADDCSLEASAKGLELTTQADQDVGTVLTDASRVEQVLSNLLSNAIKYTDSGSVSIGARRTGNEVEISVTDTGIGIPPEALQAIFEPFHRLPLAGGRVQEGAGLGLPISRQLARMLGGSLEVESTPGTGSTFRLRLPAVNRPAHDSRGNTTILRKG